MGRTILRRPGDSGRGFKPHPWAIQRRFLAPEYRRLWDGLVAGFPMWAGAGDTRVFGPKANLFPSNILEGGAVWARGKRGLAIDTTSATADTGIDLGTSDPISQGNWTLVVAANLVAFPATADWMQWMSKRNSGGETQHRWFWFTQKEGEANSKEFMLGGVGTFALGFIPSVGPHVWAVSDDGTNVRCHEDGVLKTTTASTLTFGPLTTATVQIGRNQPAGTENFNGAFDCAYMFDRVLSDADQMLLGSDPFGLFRMDFGAVFASPQQIGLPWAIGSKDAGWEDELTNTSDAELVNSVDVEDVVSTWIRGP